MAESEVVSEKKKVESTSESPGKKTQGLDADAFHNFLQGKRHILVRDYAHAVESLADACELYVKHYGETAAECGEVYYHYGLALFRLFQQQAGILGDVLPGSDEEEEEEEDEEEDKSDSDEDKDKENIDSNNSNENEAEQEEGDDDADEEDLIDEDEETKREEMEPEISTTGTTEDADNSSAKHVDHDVGDNVVSTSHDSVKDAEGSPGPKSSVPSEKITIADADSSTAIPVDAVGPSEQACNSSNIDINEAGPSTSQPKPKPEDISDLQLAWETLETAKSIFKRQDGRDAQLKMADILIILAEISMELENYTSAVDDLDECLHIRKHCLEPDDRSIAETYYQLALAYTYDSKVQPALENYENSMNVIKLRIEKLKNQTEVKQTPDGFDIDPQVEIKELEDLLPEIRAKMEDTQDMMPDAKKVVKEMAFQTGEEGSSGSSTNKPISNISHLLKRKKPEDAEAAKPSEVKKMKLVGTENGSSDKTNEMATTESASPPKV